MGVVGVSLDQRAIELEGFFPIAAGGVHPCQGGDGDTVARALGQGWRQGVKGGYQIAALAQAVSLTNTIDIQQIIVLGACLRAHRLPLQVMQDAADFRIFAALEQYAGVLQQQLR